MVPVPVELDGNLLLREGKIDTVFSAGQRPKLPHHAPGKPFFEGAAQLIRKGRKAFALWTGFALQAVLCTNLGAQGRGKVV